MDNKNMNSSMSLRYLIKRFFSKIALTWGLVIFEAASLVFMPMLIGKSVDGLMNKNLNGIYQLSALCIILLLVGAARRFYDTRAYGKIYSAISCELVEKEQSRDSSLSRVSARVNLFDEFIDFLESSIPQIIHEFINLFGTLAIIFFINLYVFYACIGSIVVTGIVYRLSKNRIYRLNKNANDEIEKQVDVLKSGNPVTVKSHFRNMVKWQVKLSDLDTINYTLIWIALASVMIFTIFSVTGGETSFGKIISAVMYVFGFMEGVQSFPLYYQQLIRLGEISSRLSGSRRESEPIS